MRIVHFRHSMPGNFWKLLTGIAICFVAYFEYGSYFLHQWSWDGLHVPESTPESHLRVLFVADPQITGTIYEPNTVGFITRWDCDRFLHRTFTLAVSRLQPDVIVYLGDVMDEGSEASDADFETYVDRFKNVFRTNDKIQHVYLAGDNDIGGEEFDIRTDEKIQRFNKYFPEQGVKSVKFVDFLRLHFDFAHDPSDVAGEVEMLAKNVKNDIRVVLNHMTVLERPKPHLMPIIKGVQASILITAHSHKAQLHTCLDCWEEDDPSINTGLHIRIPLKPWMLASKAIRDGEVFHLKVNDGYTIHEINVPTCNYRMGEEELGYGAAVFGADGNVLYTVYWIPSRYTQLFTYVRMLAVFATVATLRLIYRWRHALWSLLKTLLS